MLHVRGQLFHCALKLGPPRRRLVVNDSQDLMCEPLDKSETRVRLLGARYPHFRPFEIISGNGGFNCLSGAHIAHPARGQPEEAVKAIARSSERKTHITETYIVDNSDGKK